MFKFFKKAISPVVATALLLVIAVISVVGFQGWFTTFSSGVFVDVETQTSSSNNVIVEGLVGEKLYVISKGNSSINSIKINDVDCNFNGSVSGLDSVNISSCLENVSGSANIVVVTDDGIFESYKFVNGDVSGSGGSSSNVFSVTTDVKYFNIGNTNTYDYFTQDNVYNNKFYFSSINGGLVGNELYVYDGTTTNLVEDINSGVGDSNPLRQYQYGGDLYFGANNGTTGEELFKFDGTSVSLVNEISAGASHGSPENFEEYNGDLYFRANDGNSGRELYKFNGTTVSLVSDINSGPGHSNPSSLKVFNGDLYFSANDGTNGYELYKFDGNTVSLVNNLYPGGSGSSPSDLTIFNGDLYFVANDGTNGKELYKFDGSTMNLIQDLNPGSSSSYPSSLINFNNKIYFKASNGSTSYELYSFDGTNISLTSDLEPGSSGSYPDDFYVYKNNLFFGYQSGGLAALGKMGIDEIVVDISSNVTGWDTDTNYNVFIFEISNNLGLVQHISQG